MNNKPMHESNHGGNYNGILFQGKQIFLEKIELVFILLKMEFLLII
jgi:hypothetical protein